MGLDITVYKLTKTAKKNDYYFRLVDDDGNYDNHEFPEWAKKFEKTKTESWYDWEKFKNDTGINTEEYEFYMEHASEKGYFLTLKQKGVELPVWNSEKYKSWDEYEAEENKMLLEIDLDKVPTYKKKIKVIYHKEVGYQRKGLNSNFYDDYQNGKIGYFVWTKAELERYKTEYCDNPEDFQHNIIDNFVEGEDCVTFDW